MIILGIESSCDDTSVALIDMTDERIFVLSEKTASQIEIHKKYGGVVPEIAGRMHAEKIVPLIEEILKDQPKPNAIAVTAGPGLMAGLLVGVEAAKTLSYLTGIPVVPTNHIEGHLYSALLARPESGITTLQFPALALIVSGGHTELILMRDHGSYELVGKTRDDAAGEAFDKVAKLLELEYPGGPKISKLAAEGSVHAIPFPRPMLREANYDFSFAGLKTAVLYWLRDNTLAIASIQRPLFPFLSHFFEKPEPAITIHDFCASFEEAVIDVLAQKTEKAAKQFNPKTLILGGGVSANKQLRERLKAIPVDTFLTPPLPYCMDNATMIAVAGYIHARNGEYTDWDKIVVDPNWKIHG